MINNHHYQKNPLWVFNEMEKHFTKRRGVGTSCMGTYIVPILPTWLIPSLFLLGSLLPCSSVLCYLVALFPCFLVALFPCYSVFLFPCYSVSLLPCYSVTLLPCYQGGLAARSGTEFTWSPQLRNSAEWDWVQIFLENKYGGECRHGRTMSFCSILSCPAYKYQEKVSMNFYNGPFGH